MTKDKENVDKLMISGVEISIPLRKPMLIFEIYGDPIPQRQTRQGMTKTGKKVFYDPSKTHKQQIIWQIRPHAPVEPLLGPIGMDVTFYMPIPKSATKIRREQMINGMIRPTTKPDFDNMCYLITNAMKELVYNDDAQVVDCYTHKYYHTEPKTVIKLWQINH